MKAAQKHLRSASGTVMRSILTMIVCAGIAAVLFALKPGLASSVREMIHLPRSAPFSNYDQVAQNEENEEEPTENLPDVSSVFLEKLSAITHSASPPDQKLSAIDELVRSYGWPSTPPAIDKVVTEARRKISLEKPDQNANQGTQNPPREAGDVDYSHTPESEQLGAFIAFSGKFYVAQYCADNGAFFTPDDLERLKVAYQKMFSSMTVAQETRDAVWQKMQTFGPAQLADMTAEQCAAEKQSYLFTMPQLFAPSDSVANPF